MTTNPSNDDDEPVSWRQWIGMALLMNAVLAGLEFLAYRELAPVERGEATTGATWGPIATIYNAWGFTAALAVIPILWLGLISIFLWQTWLRIQAERKQNNLVS